MPARRYEDHDGWVRASTDIDLGQQLIDQLRRHSGYSRSFVRLRDRELPGRAYVDQNYPACWWIAADGVNADALEIFLPQLR